MGNELLCPACNNRFSAELGKSVTTVLPPSQWWGQTHETDPLGRRRFTPRSARAPATRSAYAKAYQMPFKIIQVLRELMVFSAKSFIV